MRRLATVRFLLLITPLLALSGCSDDDDDVGAACDPACGPCQRCDTSGAAPVCVDQCGTGLECQDGVCVAPAAVECDPACGACQMCDTSDATPVCVDYCGTGLTCQDGECVAPAAVECEPACGACQMCDTSGATPTCVDNCAAGLECQDGVCVEPAAVVCEPACGDCQVCDTTGGTPTCVDNCAAGLECANGACVLPADPCAGTCATCQECDAAHGVPTCVDACGLGKACDATAEVCRPTPGGATFDHSAVPGLQGPFTVDAAGGRAITAQCLGCHAQAGADFVQSAHYTWIGPTPNLQGHASPTVGKRNLVNNFCVAVPSNEPRCAQCHAGYGYTNNTFDFTDTANIDCLVCHAPSYVKSKTAAGAPDSAVMDGAALAAAAQGVGKPTRQNCGRCHFTAGGGDNVKKGDLGSAMGSPTAAADVHMGAATDAFQCSSCHTTTGHRIPGQGAHLPVAEGRLGCEDCHGEAPHTVANLNNHALDVACQTCHIPAFSRQQPTKMDWNWSTAGDRTRGTNGIENGTAGGDAVVVYDAMKGDFIWMKNVRPSYAWYDGRVERMTLEDSYPAGSGTVGSPIQLGGPVAGIGDGAAKIHPFKVMHGQQAVDTTTRKVLAPKLFGAGGFWPQIPAAADYTPQAVEDLWTSTLTAGALYAGQIAAGESFTGRATGAKPWDWAYTEMYMLINHEVAPASQALGCSSCHFNNADWDWTALGYACDPQTDPLTCGSRHP